MFYKCSKRGNTYYSSDCTKKIFFVSQLQRFIYIQVKAWDADGSAPNNRVVYRIQQGAEDKFVMDADTGIVTVAHGANLDPDRSEPKSTLYPMVVVALDGGIGSRQRQAAVQVNITIVDVNNKAPVFQEPGTIHVRENTPVCNCVPFLSFVCFLFQN